MDNPLFERIRAELNASDVVLYMKGTPAFPQCGFSAAAAQILAMCKVPFTGVDILPDAALRQAIKDFSNWPTIPQLYVKGEFIGGCDIMKEMYQSGELQQLLKDKGVKADAA